MIQTKEDLKRYLESDRIARGESKKKPSLIGDFLWRFQITYRKCEYYSNNRTNLFDRFMHVAYYCLYKDECKKLCSEIPLNCIEEGLVIWHGQNIIINGNSKIGKNFSNTYLRSIQNVCRKGSPYHFLDRLRYAKEIKSQYR